MGKHFVIIIAIFTFFIVLISVGIITSNIDSSKVATGHDPKYCIKVVSYDGSKVTYWRLGHKFIRYVGVSQNEPYQNNIDINSLDDFYNIELTKNSDIRNLGEKYTCFDAQKDIFFVVGAMVHNDYLYNEFMDNYNNKKTAFIRVVQNSIEGNIIIYDILYYEKTNKLYLVTDNTRDMFSAKIDRKIKLKQF